MKRKEILAIVAKYKKKLERSAITPRRIAKRRTFGSCTHIELLQHALYLVVHIEEIDSVRQRDKLNRHFAAMQMCLSFADWYTLESLMNHNRPK